MNNNRISRLQYRAKMKTALDKIEEGEAKEINRRAMARLEQVLFGKEDEVEIPKFVGANEIEIHEYERGKKCI